MDLRSKRNKNNNNSVKINNSLRGTYSFRSNPIGKVVKPKLDVLIHQELSKSQKDSWKDLNYLSEENFNDIDSPANSSKPLSKRIHSSKKNHKRKSYLFNFNLSSFKKTQNLLQMANRSMNKLHSAVEETCNNERPKLDNEKNCSIDAELKEGCNNMNNSPVKNSSATDLNSNESSSYGENVNEEIIPSTQDMELTNLQLNTPSNKNLFNATSLLQSNNALRGNSVLYLNKGLDETECVSDVQQISHDTIQSPKVQNEYLIEKSNDELKDTFQANKHRKCSESNEKDNSPENSVSVDPLSTCLINKNPEKSKESFLVGNELDSSQHDTSHVISKENSVNRSNLNLEEAGVKINDLCKELSPEKPSNQKNGSNQSFSVTSNEVLADSLTEGILEGSHNKLFQNKKDNSVQQEINNVITTDASSTFCSNENNTFLSSNSVLNVESRKISSSPSFNFSYQMCSKGYSPSFNCSYQMYSKESTPSPRSTSENRLNSNVDTPVSNPLSSKNANSRPNSPCSNPDSNSVAHLKENSSFLSTVSACASSKEKIPTPSYNSRNSGDQKENLPCTNSRPNSGVVIENYSHPGSCTESSAFSKGNDCSPSPCHSFELHCSIADVNVDKDALEVENESNQINKCQKSSSKVLHKLSEDNLVYENTCLRRSPRKRKLISLQDFNTLNYCESSEALTKNDELRKDSSNRKTQICLNKKMFENGSVKITDKTSPKKNVDVFIQPENEVSCKYTLRKRTVSQGDISPKIIDSNADNKEKIKKELKHSRETKCKKRKVMLGSDNDSGLPSEPENSPQRSNSYLRELCHNQKSEKCENINCVGYLYGTSQPEVTMCEGTDNPQDIEVEPGGQRNLDLSSPSENQLNNSEVMTKSKNGTEVTNSDISSNESLDDNKRSNLPDNLSNFSSKHSDNINEDLIVIIGEHEVNITNIVNAAYKKWRLPLRILKNIQAIDTELVWNKVKMFDKIKNPNQTKSTSTNDSLFNEKYRKLVYRRWLEFCRLYKFDCRKPRYFFNTPITMQYLSIGFMKYFTTFLTQDLKCCYTKNSVLKFFQSLFEDAYEYCCYSEREDAILLALHKSLGEKFSFVNHIAAFTLKKSYTSIAKRYLKLRSIIPNCSPIKKKSPKKKKIQVKSPSTISQSHSGNGNVDNSSKSTINESNKNSKISINNKNCDLVLKSPEERLNYIKDKSEILINLLDGMLKISGHSRATIGKISNESLSERQWCIISSKLKNTPAYSAKALFQTKIHPLITSTSIVNKYKLISDILEYLKSKKYKCWDDIKWSEMSKSINDLKPLFIFVTFVDFVKNEVPLDHQTNYKDCIDYLFKEKMALVKQNIEDDVVLDIFK